jgi:hypothetical protein
MTEEEKLVTNKVAVFDITGFFFRIRTRVKALLLSTPIFT